MMRRDDHNAAILDLLALGKLDEALSELARTESSSRKPGIEVLIPLARALLEAGRSRESLRILKRASISAAFGGDLEQITTQIGMPSGSLRLGTSGDLEVVHDTAPAGPPPDEIIETRVDQLDVDKTPLETDRFVAAHTLSQDKAADTDEVPLLETPEAEDTQPNQLPERPSPAPANDLGVFDRHEAFLENLGTADESALETESKRTDFEKRPTMRFDSAIDPPDEENFVNQPTSFYGVGRATREPSYEATGDVDDSASNDGPRRDVIKRETWTKPFDIGHVLPAGPSVEEMVAEAQALRSSSLDSTGKVELPEYHELDTPREPLKHRTGGGDLKDAKTEVEIKLGTGKLNLKDIEVVGTFVAGVGTSQPLHATPDPLPPVGAASMEETDRVQLPRSKKKEPKDPKKERRDPKTIRRAIVGVVLGVIAILVVIIALVGRGGRDQAEELARVRELLTDDTYTNHLHALAVLSDLSNRYGGGSACAEFAAESAQMWGRFGREAEHGERARSTLEACPREGNEEAHIYAQSLLELYSGDVATSHGLAREAVNTYPQSARLRTVLAKTLVAQSQDEQARAELDVAKMIDPDYIPATLLLAKLQRRAGHRGQARVLLDRIHKQSPDHVEANAEGLMLELDGLSSQPHSMRLQKLSTLGSKLESDVQGQPPSIAAYVSLVRSRLARAQGDIDRWVILINQARDLSSREAKLYISKGLRLNGDLRGALEVSQDAARMGVEMQLERAHVLVAVGRPEEALRVIGTLEPSSSGTDIDSQRSRLEAKTLPQLGDTIEARELEERLVKNQDDPETLLLLSEHYVTRGRWIEARDILTKVSSRPWDSCAEAARQELRGGSELALSSLEEHGAPREPCTLRLRSLLVRRSGDVISEISALSVLLRIDPQAQDRIALARAVWRERGARAALAELRPVFAAPPTALAPLLDTLDLLSSLHGDREASLLLDGAERAGAKGSSLSTARAHYERLRDRPQVALEYLSDVSGEAQPKIAILERASALLDLGRDVIAAEALRGIQTDPCSPLWVDSLKLASTIQVRSEGFGKANKALSKAIMECADIGSKVAEQELALWRVELGLNSKLPLTAVESMLRTVPPWPPTPSAPYLGGRIRELEGNVEAARQSYAQALKIDEAHIPSLTRLVELEEQPTLRRRLRQLTTSPVSESTDP